MTTLNLGAGTRAVPEEFVVGDVISVDLSGKADLTADVRSLPLPDRHADVVYASHLLEHFDEHELPQVLWEWKRVLKPGGRLVIEVPDIQQVAQEIVSRGVDAVIYESPVGPIRAQDTLYGLQRWVKDQPLMRHKVAFDGPKLSRTLSAAGFVGTVRQMSNFDLLADARKE